MQRQNSRSNAFIFTMLLILLVMSSLFWTFSYVVSLTELTSFDVIGIDFIQGKVSEKVTPLMSIFTFLGSTTWFALTTIAIFIYLFMKRRKTEAFLFVGTMACSGIVNQLLKLVYQRPRPTIQPLIEATGYSFPSGHSMASFTFYGLLAFFMILKTKNLVSKIAVILFFLLIILSVGVSRIYFGVHYPTDVLAGFTAGAAVLILFFIAYQRTMDKLRKK